VNQILFCEGKADNSKSQGERKSVSETLDLNRSLTGPTKREANLGHEEPGDDGTDHQADAVKF
jgi:hypothetical protein